MIEIIWTLGFPKAHNRLKYFRAIIQCVSDKKVLVEVILKGIEDGYKFKDGDELSYNYNIIMWRPLR